MASPLFRQYSVFDVIESRKIDLKEEIKRMSASALQGDAHEIAEQLVAKYLLSVPLLQEDKQHATQREIQIDMTGDRTTQFNMGYPEGPIYVSATEVTVSIPFEGDPQLFNVKPSRFSFNGSRGYVSDHVLNLVFVVRQGNQNLKQQYAQTLQSIRDHLGWLSESAAEMREKLALEAVPAIVNRKLDLDARAAAVSSLGIPVRDHVEVARAAQPIPTSRPDEPKRTASEKWDAFICHASEDKDEIARPLATELQAKGLRVWYDEFSLKLGDSLRESIDRGLSRSSFGVVILSKHFFEKHWPTRELNGLVAREADGEKVILPVWHRITEPEVREYSPILADRFAVGTDRGLGEVVARILEAVSAAKDG